MKSSRRGYFCRFAWVTLSGLMAPALFAQGNSHIRIVRLSFAEGAVTIQKPGADTWVKAPVNTPIQEGFKLSTGPRSFAEVEFENGSTARIGEGTELDFSELVLTPAGGKINRMTLAQGYATLHSSPERDDVYELKAAGSTMAAEGKAEFRADLEDSGLLRVEVFQGSVSFTGEKGTVRLTKNKVLELQPGSGGVFALNNGITRDSWDDWVQGREEVTGPDKAPRPLHAGYTNYGWNDLDTYGDWAYFHGMGYGWIPYQGIGWSPFSLGQWSWYPSFGYTWISAEPWGWLPYHYGSWAFQPGWGWVWLPGAFSTWSPAQVVWYQGPGWIGWAPKSSSQGAGTQATGTSVTAPGSKSGCTSAQGCVVAVSSESFAGGKPLAPSSLMAVRATPAQQISQPSAPVAFAERLAGETLQGASPVHRVAPAGSSTPGVSAPSAKPSFASEARSVPPAASVARRAAPASLLTRPPAVPANSGAGYAVFSRAEDFSRRPTLSGAGRSPSSAASSSRTGYFGGARGTSHTGSYGGTSHSSRSSGGFSAAAPAGGSVSSSSGSLGGRAGGASSSSSARH